MGCDCNKVVINDPCITPACEAVDCNCPLKLGTICVIYDGVDLLTIQAVAGDNLQEILIKIDALLGQLFGNNFFLNIGTGAELFKQVNVSGQAEFRTLVSADDSITITENADEIDFIVNSGVLGEDNTASNVGSGEGLFKQKTGVDLEFKSVLGIGGVVISSQTDTITIDGTSVVGTTYTGSNLGLGGQIFNQVNGTDFEYRTVLGVNGISISQQTNTITIDGSGAAGTTYTGSNLGGGAEVFKQLNGTDFEHRTVIAGNGININQVGDTIEVVNSAPANTAAEQIERTVSFSLDNTMNEQVIFINNGGVTVTITVPVLNDDFKCGVVQLGTGKVDFVSSGTTINSYNGDLAIGGQYLQAFIQKRNAGTNEFILLGNLIP